MSLSVFNWILVTLSTCSEKILLDPCRVFLEYIEIEQGKRKALLAWCTYWSQLWQNISMLVLLLSTTCTPLIKYEFSCREYFTQPFLYYGDFPLPYLLELILLEEEVPTELGLPSDLLRLHHHQLTNKRWKKISCWLQSGLITCLPIEKNK